MASKRHRYFDNLRPTGSKDARDRHQRALLRCVDRLRATMPVVGLRNPKIGLPDHGWSYCGPFDWVISFHAGQLWLALQLSGDPVFLNAARARRPVFARILRTREAQDHDLGFQFSLSCVAEWQMTGDAVARDMALRAAEQLLSRYRPEGGYIQAWNAKKAGMGMAPDFANGRVIADTMQNLALLYWAGQETGRGDFVAAANGHADTAMAHLIRDDDTSFHTFVFNPSTGEPVRGETFQGFAHGSCWSRGQAWLIHGFAQTALTTGNPAYLDAAERLAAKARQLMGDDTVPVWDYGVDDPAASPRDSSAGAIMAAGLYILSQIGAEDRRDGWRAFADRVMGGLLDSCDLTTNPEALGFLAHGTAHSSAGYDDNMLPYGDYYFMEALMRSLGHDRFFW